MQLELKRIQREVGITFVYVTHDQEEALTMSDRLAVFNQGRIEQLGSPVEVYERPATDFVAGFIGVSNLLERDGRQFTIRPEKIRLLGADEQPPAGSHVEEGRIDDVVYLGMVTRYLVELADGGRLTAVRQNLDSAAAEARAARGTAVRVAWRDEQTYRDQPAGRRPPGGSRRNSDAEMDAGWRPAGRRVGRGAHRGLRVVRRQFRQRLGQRQLGRQRHGRADPAAGGHGRAVVGRQDRGQAEPDRLGGLRPAAVGQAVRRRRPGAR